MKGENFIKTIGEHWSVILFIGGMLVTWGQFSGRIDFLEKRIDKVESTQSMQTNDISEIKGDIKEIKNSLTFIRERLN